MDAQQIQLTATSIQEFTIGTDLLARSKQATIQQYNQLLGLVGRVGGQLSVTCSYFIKCVRRTEAAKMIKACQDGKHVIIK